MTGAIGLRHGRVSDLGPARAAVHFLSDPEVDGEPMRLVLSVMPDDAPGYRVTLHLGERFSVGGTTWVFDRVDDPGDYAYTAWLAPARPAQAPATAEPAAPAPIEGTGRTWAERIADILEFIRFETRLDDAVVHKTAEAILHTRMLHEPPARMAEAIPLALASPVTVTELVPVGFAEPEFRDFLRRLAARLDGSRPWPEWLYEQVDPATWDSSRVRPIAYLGLPPVRLGNLLGVLFERVVEDGMTMELAVLRLAAGPVVALAREVGGRSAGTLVLQQPGEPAGSAVAEVLRASGIGPDSVTWLGDAP